MAWMTPAHYVLVELLAWPVPTRCHVQLARGCLVARISCSCYASCFSAFSLDVAPLLPHQKDLRPCHRRQSQRGRCCCCCLHLEVRPHLPSVQWSLRDSFSHLMQASGDVAQYIMSKITSMKLCIRRYNGLHTGFHSSLRIQKVRQHPGDPARPS
ncbi:hypothetical protein EJ02DRAFT_46026 [Clathrospora elynae]|uniref:Secreted protein n=1 Tax=Clathrospora elynae TaxID=706981 RepID=A0A6A5T9B1_9PLEO|nr:hypothetical protein EJ02DRAFT_46026 [Clathrospora elynae]